MTNIGGRQMPAINEMLEPASGAGRLARQVIARACAQWRLPHLVPDANLVATELVTNAAVHARTPINLRAMYGRRHLVIRVRDRSTIVPMTPAPAQTAQHRLHDSGRGLLIVCAIAESWGFWRFDGGKVVWAALRHQTARAIR